MVQQIQNLFHIAGSLLDTNNVMMTLCNAYSSLCQHVARSAAWYIIQNDGQR